MKNIRIALPVLGFAALAVAAGVFAHQSRLHAKRALAAAPELETDSPEAELELQKMREVAEVIRRSEISTALGVSYADLRTFFVSDVKLGREPTPVHKAWLELLDRVVSESSERNATADELASSAATADAVGAYIRLHRATEGSNMSFRAEDLPQAAKSWTPERKQDLVDVLNRATEIARFFASKGRPATTDTAFRLGLSAFPEKGVAVITGALRAGDYVSVREAGAAGPRPEAAELGTFQGISVDGSSVVLVGSGGEAIEVPLRSIKPASVRYVRPGDPVRVEVIVQRSFADQPDPVSVVQGTFKGASEGILDFGWRTVAKRVKSITVVTAGGEPLLPPMAGKAVGFGP